MFKIKKMKKVMTIFGAIIFASLILTSCGGGDGTKENPVKPNKFKGDLSDYFEIVDGTYKLEIRTYNSGENSEAVLKVQVKRNEKTFEFDAVELAGYTKYSNRYIALECELLDNSKVPVETTEPKDLKTLASLKTNETGWAEFSFPAGDANKFDKVQSFNLLSTIKLSTETNSTESSAISSESEGSTSNVDCDQFIKDYSAFADSYVKLMKKYKANSSDPSILTEYTEAAQKAMDMQKDASSCTDPAYASKLMEIANKIAKAAI
jgi:hypothetical protein